METRAHTNRLLLLAAMLSLAPAAALADSGLYIGGAIGGATVEANFGDTGIPGFPTGEFDEDDTAFKVFAGYNFDLPVINFGLEAGYVDFGAPELDTNQGPIELDPTGINLWGIAGVDAGLFDLYAKVGYILWDVEVTAFDDNFTDDGSDLGYGLGLSFGLGGFKIRGEYEMYDIDEADVSMLSLGVLYQFD